MSVRSSSASPNDPLAERRWLGRWFTAARREGLLALLSPNTWHTLSAILSFTSRDGRRSFTVDQLAVALGQPRTQALSRLEQLIATEWKGQPLATLERDPHDEIVGALLAPLEVLGGERAPLPDRTAAEAILDQLPAPGDETSADDLVEALQAVGLNPDQIDWLLHSFPRVRIRRQLGWLPARQARNPAALLLRAIEQDWGAPREGR